MLPRREHLLIAHFVPCGSDIAIALHTPPHRAVSLALVAQAVSATQGKGRLSLSMKNLSTGSFMLRKGRISSRKRALSAKVSKAVDVKVTIESMSQHRG